VKRIMECPAETFSNKTDSTGCIECFAGRYADQKGQTECRDCEAGLCSESVAVLSCILCSVGTKEYSAIDGSTKYENDTKQISCAEYPPGSYSFENGLNKYIICPQNIGRQRSAVPVVLEPCRRI
jgi:hypothetical protein